MTKWYRIAAALFVLPLSTGLAAAATDDSTDGSSALGQASTVERGWVARDIDQAEVVNTPPSGCSGYSTYLQPLDPDNSEFAASSEHSSSLEAWSAEATLNGSDVIAALGAGKIEKLRWWGVSEEWDPDQSPGNEFLGNYCSTDDAANRAFRLVFYSNDGGLPGEPLAIRDIVPTDFLTDECWDCQNNNHFIAEYQATISPAVDATNVAWISIRRHAGSKINGNNECVFAWVSESTAAHDEKWVQNGAAFTDDLTYCVHKGTAANSYTDLFYGDFERGDTRYWTVGGE